MGKVEAFERFVKPEMATINFSRLSEIYGANKVDTVKIVRSGRSTIPI